MEPDGGGNIRRAACMNCSRSRRGGRRKRSRWSMKRRVELPGTEPAGQPARPLFKEVGAGPEALVGICVERSLEMTIGVAGDLEGWSSVRAA